MENVLVTGEVGPAHDARGQQRRSRPRPRYFSRRKVCQFCVDGIDTVDFKDVEILKRFVSDRFMIEARRKSGVCAKHQRALAKAVKRARQLSLIPFTSSHKGSFSFNYRSRN